MLKKGKVKERSLQDCIKDLNAKLSTLQKESKLGEDLLLNQLSTLR
jgi:hypothetical protein